MSEGKKLHIRLPSSGVLYWEDEPPEHLDLKASTAFFWETGRAVGNRLHS